MSAQRPTGGTLRGLSYSGGDSVALHAWAMDGPPVAPLLVLLHAGGPDHHSMLPLARHLADLGRVVTPDIRGYGASTCRDPAAHTWDRYSADVVALLDALGASSAVLAGAGLGSTIALRTALTHPDRVSAVVAIGVEDIEDDEAKAAEIAFLDAFARRVAEHGIAAGWEPILDQFPPLVGAMVRDAIPRSDPASIVAAAAIAHDRSFATVGELAAVTAPVLVFPGTDPRHPTALAEHLAATVAGGQLARVRIDAELHTADDLAAATAPAIRAFLTGPAAPRRFRSGPVG
ncbi:alpha/beta fold hydrolase [Nocardia sp. NPDC057353]|uniref:alpha/beta fold hydrolase n=1 Tax=Nocardia sp. NPDC057353 TaxID=3346104 RepID=UPI00363071CF